jgi:hypothetical protein
MPALPKEFMGSLYQQGAMIYGGQLSINADQQSNVARAFERYKEALETAVGSPQTAPVRVSSTRPPSASTATRTRAGSLTQRITTVLTSTPAGMTIAQLARRVNSQAATVQRIVTAQVTTGSYLKEGNKYRMTAPTAAATTAARPAASTSRTRSSRTRTRSRAASSGAETATDRVANLVLQRPGISKAEVITAMAPARPNHVGIWLSRLCKANRITGTNAGQDGPYYPTATSQRQAAAA